MIGMSKTLTAIYRELRVPTGDENKVEIKFDTNEGQIIIGFPKHSLFYLRREIENIQKDQ